MIALYGALALAAPLMLDAGSLGSPVLVDFARLDPTGCEDPRVTWATPPARAGWQGRPDPLAGDFVEGGVLRLDLEAGRWSVLALLGRESGAYLSPWPVGGTIGVRVDGEVAWSAEVPSGGGYLASPWYAANPFPVFREGETAWERQIAAQHVWRAFEIDVAEGGSTLEVFGAPLQGLVAVPAGVSAEGEVLVAVADAHRRRWFLERVDPSASSWSWPLPQDGPLRAARAEWLDLPDPSAAEPGVDLAVAPDERVGLVWWLFPGDGSATVEIEGLEALAPSLFEVHALDAAAHTLRAVRPRPAFLRPSEGALRGGQGYPVGVALTGRVPADAPPGEIAGTIRVRRGDEVLAIPVRLRVRALDLAAPPAPVGVFADLRHPLTLAFGEGSAEVWDAFDRDLAMMRERGFGVLGVRFAAPWPRTWPSDRPPDTTLFAEAAARWRRGGGGPLVWLDPVPWVLDSFYKNPARPLGTPAVQATLRGLAEAAVAEGALLYAYDEAALQGFEAVPRAVEIADALRAQVPEVHLAAGEMHPLGWSLAGTYDVVMVSVVPPVASGNLAAMRAAGASPWLYNQVPGRAGTGLLPFVAGADASITWAWDDVQGDPFHDVHARRQWQLALLAPDGGIWPTPLLESTAEGVTDQRYLATLDMLVVEAEARGGRYELAAAPGRRLLEVVRQIDGAPQLGLRDGGVWAESDLARLRVAVGDAAERLSACLARRRDCPRAPR